MAISHPSDVAIPSPRRVCSCTEYARPSVRTRLNGRFELLLDGLTSRRPIVASELQPQGAVAVPGRTGTGKTEWMEDTQR